MSTHATGFKMPVSSTAQGASSTAEFQFFQSSGVAGSLPVPPGQLSNRLVRIKAGGRFTNVAGGATTFTAKINWGADIASDTNVATSGAMTITTTSGNWNMDVVGYVDTGYKKFAGAYQGAHTAATPALITRAIVSLTSFDPALAQSFNCSGQFSVSDAGNAATLDYFEVDLL